MLQQLVYHFIKILEGGVVIAFEGSIKRFEEIEGVVKDFVVVDVEVFDTDFYDAHDESLEGDRGNFFDVCPDGSIWLPFGEVCHNLLSEGADIPKRGKGVSVFGQFVVLEDDLSLVVAGGSFGEELGAEVEPHGDCPWREPVEVDLVHEVQVGFEVVLEGGRDELEQF